MLAHMNQGLAQYQSPKTIGRNALRGPQEAVNERTLAAYAKLEPADDLMAQAVTPPALRLTTAEKTTIATHAKAFQAALQEVVEGEAALSRAARLQALLPGLEKAAQRAAADAFLSGSAPGTAGAATAERNEAEAAALAIPVLQERLGMARNRAAEHRSAVCRAVMSARAALKRRASETYERAVVDILRAIAVHQALADTGGREDHSHFIVGVAGRINLPAVEPRVGIAPAEFANGSWRHAGLQSEPERLHAVCAQGHLVQDMAEALGGVIKMATLLR